MTMLSKSAVCLLAIVAMTLAAPALASTVVITTSPVGTEGGTTSFRAEVDAALGDFCYVLNFKGLGPIRDAAIIPADAAGDTKPLVTLEISGAATDMCIAVEPKVLEPILAEPARHHLVLRATARPQGVARGPLARP